MGRGALLARADCKGKARGALAEDPGSGDVGPLRRPSGFTTVARFDWTIPLVRLVVDFGLLVIVLVSLAIGRPFTLQYARETTSPEIWNRPEFMAVNRRITLVWAAAFAVLVLADAGMAFLPQIPHGVMILVTVAALLFASKYTAQSTKAS